MENIINIAIEKSPNGMMIHLIDMPGAFTRGESYEIAAGKIIAEAQMYAEWLGVPHQYISPEIRIMQTEENNAQICDGDSEILIAADKAPEEGFLALMNRLALKSAQDFQSLYDSIPDKEFNDQSKRRETFYGPVPANAKEMLAHVDGVKSYYLSRIDLPFEENAGGLIANRQQCLDIIECNSAITNQLYCKNNEYWTLAKVLRRFIWHDRIHARALYRFAARTWRQAEIANPFCFRF